ncbi:unnamed protein product [Ixodes pacificus]
MRNGDAEGRFRNLRSLHSQELKRHYFQSTRIKADPFGKSDCYPPFFYREGTEVGIGAAANLPTETKWWCGKNLD